MTQKWKSQLYFGTFILNLDCSEKGGRCARKRRKSEVSLCQKVVQKRGTNVKSVFLGTTFAWQKRCVIFVKSKKTTAEMMFTLHIKYCKVESFYPIQKCSDRFRDR